MLGDLGHDVESAVFTICDFNHTGREINRKGLLRATADKKVEKIKLAYYAVQNAVAVFDDTLQRVNEPAVGLLLRAGLVRVAKSCIMKLCVQRVRIIQARLKV